MPRDKNKRPNPKILGTGAAAKAGATLQARRKAQKARLDAIMGKINKGASTGTK